MTITICALVIAIWVFCIMCSPAFTKGTTSWKNFVCTALRAATTAHVFIVSYEKRKKFQHTPIGMNNTDKSERHRPQPHRASGEEALPAKVNKSDITNPTRHRNKTALWSVKTGQIAAAPERDPHFHTANVTQMACTRTCHLTTVIINHFFIVLERLYTYIHQSFPPHCSHRFSHDFSFSIREMLPHLSARAGRISARK